MRRYAGKNYASPNAPDLGTSGNCCYKSPPFRWPLEQKKRRLWGREWTMVCCSSVSFAFIVISGIRIFTRIHTHQNIFDPRLFLSGFKNFNVNTKRIQIASDGIRITEKLLRHIGLLFGKRLDATLYVIGLENIRIHRVTSWCRHAYTIFGNQAWPLREYQFCLRLAFIFKLG